MSISRIGHIAFTVEHLGDSVAFAEECLGLRTVEHRGDVAYLTSNSRHHQLRLQAGDAPAMQTFSFDAPSQAAVNAVGARAEEAGLDVRVVADDADLHRCAIAIDVPHGPTISVVSGARQVPTSRYPTVAPVRPRKLGHVTLSTDEPARLEQTLAGVFGMRLSDRLDLGGNAPGDLTWFRCNADHHGVGIVPGPVGLHHHAWEVADLVALGLLGDHLNERGVRYVWGPGRHGPGDDVFAYFENPAAALVEVYCDMLQIEDESTYDATRDWGGVEASANLWGPLPDPRWFAYLTPFAG